MKLDTFLLAGKGFSKKGGRNGGGVVFFFDDLRRKPCVFTLDVVVE